MIKLFNKRLLGKILFACLLGFIFGTVLRDYPLGFSDLFYLFKTFFFFIFSVFIKEINMTEKEKVPKNIQKIVTGFTQVFHFFLGILSYLFHIDLSFLLEEQISNSKKEEMLKLQESLEVFNKQMAETQEKIQEVILRRDHYDHLLKSAENVHKEHNAIKEYFINKNKYRYNSTESTFLGSLKNKIMKSVTKKQ